MSSAVYMDGEVSLMWNQLYPGLLEMAVQRERLGLYYYQNEVCVVELKEEMRDVRLL